MSGLAETVKVNASVLIADQDTQKFKENVSNVKQENVQNVPQSRNVRDVKTGMS